MVKKSGGQAELPEDPASMGRIKQIRMVAGIVRKGDPKAMPLVALTGIGILAAFVLVGLLLHLVWLFIPLGLITGLLGALRSRPSSRRSKASQARLPRSCRICAAASPLLRQSRLTGTWTSCIARSAVPA